jgi:hypothetical protein
MKNVTLAIITLVILFSAANVNADEKWNRFMCRMDIEESDLDKELFDATEKMCRKAGNKANLKAAKRQFLKDLKTYANDPKAVSISQCYYEPIQFKGNGYCGDFICLVRGKNGFGALVADWREMEIRPDKLDKKMKPYLKKAMKLPNCSKLDKKLIFSAIAAVIMND